MSKANHVPRLDHTFAAEYGEPDTVLSRSEVASVRRAAERLGLRLSTTPTGRTAQIVLMAAMNYALAMEAAAKNPYLKMTWHRVAWNAKRAIGSERYAGESEIHTH